MHMCLCIDEDCSNAGSWATLILQCTCTCASLSSRRTCAMQHIRCHMHVGVLAEALLGGSRRSSTVAVPREASHRNLSKAASSCSCYLTSMSPQYDRNPVITKHWSRLCSPLIFWWLFHVR